MAGIWAVLPAVDAVRVDATLETTARAARALGDPRTLDQLRADALTDLAGGQALLAGSVSSVAATDEQPERDEVVSRRAPVVPDTRDARRARAQAAAQ